MNEKAEARAQNNGQSPRRAWKRSFDMWLGLQHDSYEDRNPHWSAEDKALQRAAASEHGRPYSQEHCIPNSCRPQNSRIRAQNQSSSERRDGTAEVTLHPAINQPQLKQYQ